MIAATNTFRFISTSSMEDGLKEEIMLALEKKGITEKEWKENKKC